MTSRMSCSMRSTVDAANRGSLADQRRSARRFSEGFMPAAARREQEPRLGGEGPGDLQPPPIGVRTGSGPASLAAAAGGRRRTRAASRPSARPPSPPRPPQAGRKIAAITPARRPAVAADQDVLQHAQGRKHAQGLKRARDAQLGDPVGLPATQVHRRRSEEDAAGAGPGTAR